MVFINRINQKKFTKMEYLNSTNGTSLVASSEYHDGSDTTMLNGKNDSGSDNTDKDIPIISNSVQISNKITINDNKVIDITHNKLIDNANVGDDTETDEKIKENNPQKNLSRGGGKRRKRFKTSRFAESDYHNEEQLILQKALANSRVDQRRQEVSTTIPAAPVYYPTAEQFCDPLSFIMSIRSEAERYGICKIVPPSGWLPTCHLKMDSGLKLKTKRQDVHKLQETDGFDEGREYTLSEYQQMAETFAKKWYADHYSNSNSSSSSSIRIPSQEELSKDYWDIVETQKRKVTVEYASDVDSSRFGSGFPSVPLPSTNSLNSENDKNMSNIEWKSFSGVESKSKSNLATMFNDPSYYERSGWNLNNIARIDDSVLRHLDVPINGINVPWLYFGMLFSTFCWHNEDNYLYSINYSHLGANKQWYGVPGSKANLVDNTVRDFLYMRFSEDMSLLHHLTTLISPTLLLSKNVPVFQLVQEPGTFVITFPKAFHAGFSYGFNCGEAVNFATPDWLSIGFHAEQHYRLINRPSVFSHVRLLFTLLENINSFPIEYRAELREQIDKIITEERKMRAEITMRGIRDISNDGVVLPSLRFDKIDLFAVEYDELRSCTLCNHVCVLSAVACECNDTRVACIRHYAGLCKCSVRQKYMMTWVDDNTLKHYAAKVGLKKW